MAELSAETIALVQEAEAITWWNLLAVALARADAQGAGGVHHGHHHPAGEGVRNITRRGRAEPWRASAGRQDGGRR